LGRVADPAAHQLLLTRAQPRPVRLALVVRSMEPFGGGLLLSLCGGQRLLLAHHLGVRLEARGDALDVFAQCPLPLDQSLVLEQELGWSHSAGLRRGSCGAVSKRIRCAVAARSSVETISPNRASYASTFCASSCASSFR